MYEYLRKSFNDAMKSTGCKQALFKMDDNIYIKAILDCEIEIISKQRNGEYECILFDSDGFIQSTKYIKGKELKKYLEGGMLNVK